MYPEKKLQVPDAHKSTNLIIKLSGNEMTKEIAKMKMQRGLCHA